MKELRQQGTGNPDKHGQWSVRGFFNADVEMLYYRSQHITVVHFRRLCTGLDYCTVLLEFTVRQVVVVLWRMLAPYQCLLWPRV